MNYQDAIKFSCDMGLNFTMAFKAVAETSYDFEAGLYNEDELLNNIINK